MTHEEKNIQEEKDLVEEMEQEIEEIENEEGQIDEDKLEEAQTGGNSQVDKLQDALARTQADFINYKNRVERDKEEMVFFLKSDILKKILPRIDDLQRIIKNTPEEMQSGALYEWLVSIEQKLLADLDKMWVKPFTSIGEEVNPDKHDVMTTVPGQKADIIIDEFETWYELWDKVLRHAKVVVGAGE